MATNTYTYGSLGERWVVETPTSKANLDISRVKADANRWTLTQLLDDPDDSPFALANGTTATTQSASDNSTKIATTAYVDASSTSPGGSNTQVQYNNSGAFGASANLTFDGSTLAVTGALSATGNISFDGGSFIFNESGADKDFRIEGDSEPNLFFADASTDDIGIGTASPRTDVSAGRVVMVSAAGGASLNLHDTSNDKDWEMYHAGDNKLYWKLDNGAANLVLDGTNVGIGTTPTKTLQVKVDGGTSDGLSFVTAGDHTTNEYFCIGGGTPSGYSAQMRFMRGGTDGFTAESMRIDTNGNLGIKCTDPSGTGSVQAHDLVIGNTSVGSSEHTGITLMAGTGGISRLDMGDTTESARMGIYCNHSDDTMNIVTGSAQQIIIDVHGNLGLGTQSGGAQLHIVETTNADSFVTEPTNASYTKSGMKIQMTRAASDAYNFAYLESGDGADGEFKLRGDGNGYSDGGWHTGNGDYAEYFESTDGTTIEIGTSVVMDGDKVRAYNASSDSADNIIGVTRPKADGKIAGIIGNTAWSHWTDKYLTDDWGVYLREDVTVWEWDDVLATESDVVEAVAATYYAEGDDIPEGKEVGDVKTAEIVGVAVGDVKIEAGSCYERDELAKDSEWTPPAGATSSTQSIRKTNPEYDESLADDYKSREFRDEWVVIGLLGQVPVKATEATNPRWIKMKQISDAVDLWLVR
jgi:hypothetical protein